MVVMVYSIIEITDAIMTLYFVVSSEFIRAVL